MARGERSVPGERGPGLAIGVSFAVLCLGAAFLVIWSTDACDDWYTGYVPPPDPFGGLGAALAPIVHRDCRPAGIVGPTLPGPTGPAVAVADEVLESRGYVAVDGWSDPLPLSQEITPTGLEGACGVVAVAADSYATISRARVGSEPWRSGCGEQRILVAVCGSDRVVVEGSGLVKIRSYSFPGITPGIVEQSGLPLEALLAHAEAEVLLRSVGWTPTDRYVVERVAPTKSRGRVSPPRTPPSGCVPWVAVGIGLSGATASHGSGYSRTDPARGMFVLGAISCAGSGGGPADVTDIDFDDEGGDGGTVSFRPYAAPAGPAVAGAGGAVVSAIELREIAEDDLQLPSGHVVEGDAAP